VVLLRKNFPQNHNLKTATDLGVKLFFGNEEMRVILMRHGKPSLPSQKPVSFLEFKNWIDSYNFAELCDKSKPELASAEISKCCNFVICSHLNRSLDSVSMLGINKK